MKALVVSAVLAGFVATAAAGEIVPFDDHFVSMKTRAEVQAETAQAAQSGELYRQRGELTYTPSLESSGVVRSRAEVRAEVARAAASGELYRQQGEITWMEPVLVAFGTNGGSDRAIARNDAGVTKISRVQ